MVEFNILATNFTSVKVKGSWDEWKNEVELTKSNDRFVATVDIKPGHYEFKFIVDGEWKTVEDYAKTFRSGFENNVLTVEEEEPKKTEVVMPLPIAAESLPIAAELQQLSEKRYSSVDHLINQFDGIKLNPPVLEKQDSLLTNKEPYPLLIKDGTNQESQKVTQEKEQSKPKKKRWSRFFFGSSSSSKSS